MSELSDIFDGFERRKADWLAEARHRAMLIAKKKGFVTVDDVRAVCPPPDDVDPRIMGAIFRGKDWVRCDYIVGFRSASHRRPIAIFKRADMAHIKES